jgi:predicted permease
MYSYPLYRDIRDANDVFSGLLATGRTGRLEVRVDTAVGEAEHPLGRFVSGNYFSVLGVRAALGRTLGPGDDGRGGPPGATISYEYWTRRFHNDSSVIGRPLTVDGTAVAITGVAARGFDGEVVGATTDLWLPLAAHDILEPNQRVLDDRTAMWLLLIGRAKPGVTVEQARRRLVPIIRASIFRHATPRQVRRLRAHEPEYPISSAARGLSSIRARFAAPLDALMAAVALLLGIVCVNVANLLLARGIARRRELAIRCAMGANRGRIVRQLLTECIVLATLGGGAAVMVAWWASRALVIAAAGRATLALDVDPNPRVLFFTFGVALASVLLFGLIPSLRSSRIDLAASARAAGRSISAGSRLGFSMIVAQVALSLVLLTGALTLVHGVRTTLATNLGLDRDHLLIATLGIEKGGPTGSGLASVVQDLRTRVAALPGVRAVTFSENGLFTNTEWSTSIEVPGANPRQPDDSVAGTDAVGARYATTVGARMLAGRDLTPQDEGPNTESVLVNATFARFYFPAGNAVGRIVRFGSHASFHIVGVVADIRGQSLEAPEGHHARRIYYPYLHGDDTTRLGQPSELRLIVRTAGPPASLVLPVRSAVAATAPGLPIEEIAPLPVLIRNSIHEEELASEIATAIGVFALMMAAIGLFGVMSYSVARRTSEIGIRVALGARAADIGWMVVLEAMRSVALGVACGLPLLAIALRLLEHYLTDAGSPNFATIAGAAALLIACAAIATSAPARRASRIDAAQALRQD